MSAPSLGYARAHRGARPGAARPPPSGQRGQITWVTLLLVAALAGAGVLAWTWLPVYFEHYTVKQVVRDYMNQAVKNRDDEGLRRNMIAKILTLAEEDAVDVSGRRVRIPAVRLEERDVTWERDQDSQPPTLRVAFSYAREVTYPVARVKATKVFTVDLTSDLALPDWGPAR